MAGITENLPLKRKKYRWLYRLEAGLEAPMFLLGLVWLWLLIKEFIQELTPTQDKIILGIWIAFIFEFFLKLFLASEKLRYLKQNWITLVALLIPVFRVFRVLRALRILRTSSVINTSKVLRSLTSAKRFTGDLKEAQGQKVKGEINVGVMEAPGRSNKENLRIFSETLLADVSPEIEAATGITWKFHFTEVDNLSSDDPRMPSDFLDNAGMRMSEGPFDIMVVITNVALVSRKKRIEAGLASNISNTVIISTHRLLGSSRGELKRSLDSEVVRWNAATLLLHLLGHISGLKHRQTSKIMAPFFFDEKRNNVPNYNTKEKTLLKKRADALPERELHGGNALGSFIFHVLMAVKHPKGILVTLLRNKSFLLALSLPGLATAAVAPTFLLIFTAEIWDVGLNMSNNIATVYAGCSILGASFYLVRVQSLFFPRKEKRVLTEHLAIANSVIFLSIFSACIGLFIMVAGLMLVLEIYIFPEGLMSTWPTLETPQILLGDKIRLATFIGTIGVTTGALAGGLESRKVIRHLALFGDTP